MKAAAMFCLAAILPFAQTTIPIKPDKAGQDAPSSLAVRKAETSIELVEDRGLSLSYRTISAGDEILDMVGYPEDFDARALFEQLTSQRLMQSRLVVETPVELAGVPLEPGRYAVGLSGFADGNFDLAVMKDRERFIIPIVMDTSPFEAPQITFSLASISAREAALMLHARKRTGLLKIKLAEEEK